MQGLLRRLNLQNPTFHSKTLKIFGLASEMHGGAGVSALRLHQGLLNAEQNSELIYGSGSTPLACSQRFQPMVGALGRYADRLLDQFVWTARKPVASLFTRTRRLARGGIEPLLEEADIVHLHWIAKWLDWPSLFDAIPRKVPIVLTLHDSSFFAGGCHQTNGCIKYESQCSRCPMLKRDLFDLAAQGFRIREKCFEGRKIYPVPNSQWMANHASRAALLKPFPLQEPIFPGIDTTAFEPLDRPTCRRILGIPEDKFVLCAGSADLSDGNKGMRLLLEALAILPLRIREKLLLMTYGAGALPNEIAGISIHQVGFVANERLLSMVYSAADIYVTPSQMETFGMTAAEAGACGLPVVCFATGGLPEIVRHGETGWLVDLKAGSQGLADALEVAFESPEKSREMGREGRERVVENFEIRKTTQQYIALYERISGGGIAAED
jgi:glycosyltransferase involved in cell wall biosynthesis